VVDRESKNVQLNNKITYIVINQRIQNNQKARRPQIAMVTQNFSCDDKTAMVKSGACFSSLFILDVTI